MSNISEPNNDPQSTERLAEAFGPAIESAIKKHFEAQRSQWWHHPAFQVFGTLVVVLGASFAAARYFVGNEIDPKLTKFETEKLIPIRSELGTLQSSASKSEGRLEEISKQISLITERLFSEKLKAARSNAASRNEFLAELPHLIQASVGNGVTFPIDLLRETGSLALHPQSDFDANVSVAAISTIVSELSRLSPWTGKKDDWVVWNQTLTPDLEKRGAKPGRYYNRGNAQPGASAEIRPLGYPPPKAQFEEILLEDGFQLLDGFSFRNVTFLNTLVVYRGGPVTLRNVRFVNCKFEFHLTRSDAIRIPDRLIAHLPGAVTAD